ncbi:hypothetical protein T01_13318 [Trichinella spiralis]|uniref:Uncharacterized protein n=1 Tax=Trichinella spiralis TaxID=6334 RepID=A0A0V1BZ25_TRISP|nr:hypothetical protein T01_13318 [Trichinella spiralis]
MNLVSQENRNCNERSSKSLVSDVSGLYFWIVIARPGVSNALDNLTYKTTTVLYVTTDPISVVYILPSGWGCLTPITDSCRFELDELRHWPRDHVVPTDILVSNFATISRGAADGIAIDDSIAGDHVLLAAILGHGLQLPGSPRTHDRSATETVIKGGVRGLHPPRMSVKRLSEDLPQRFLDRADEAFPVASHPRGSLRDEFPVDAVAYQLTLDSVHVHVSPELPQL